MLEVILEVLRFGMREEESVAELMLFALIPLLMCDPGTVYTSLRYLAIALSWRV